MEPNWFSSKSSHSRVSPGFLLVLCCILIGQCVADECEKCFETCRCHEDVCIQVCDNKCGPGTETEQSLGTDCKSQLDACYSGCGQSALPEVANEGVDDKLMDTIVDEKIRELRRIDKFNVKKVLRSVGLDSQEQENFDLIRKCLDKEVPMEFVVNNPSQNRNCAGTLDGKNSSSTIGMALARGCDVQWISLYNRANFYETCLENYNMERLSRDVRKHTGMLDQITRNIKRYADDFSDAEIVGGAQLVGGGLLVGLGVIIPPLAPFTSIVGTLLTLTGTGTSLTATLMGASWTDQEATNFKHEMEDIEERYTDVAQLISLFLKSAKAVSDVADKTRVVNNLEEAITTAYINAVPGAIAAVKLTTMAGAKAYAKFAPKLSQKLASTSLKAFTVKGPQTVMIGKLTGKLATKLTPVKQFFGKVLSAKIAGTTVRGTLSTAGKLIVPGISLASGVYSIITGSDSSNVHNGLLYEVQKARRELEYNTDEVIKTYQDLGLVQSGNTSWRSSADISLIDYHTITASAGVRLQIESIDADGLPRRCETALLGKDHSGGGWSKMGCCRELGQCGEFFIFNHTARIRIIEGTAEIDAIQIGINGNFLPSISCGGKISASGDSPSEWMKCTKKVGMRKFKTHTSNKKDAGTTNSLYFTFQILRNDGSNFTCTTGNQINRQPNIRGESTIYEPYGDSFGTCDDAELAHALLDRNDQKPGDNIKVSVESVGYWSSDAWHVDLFKAYFLTDLSNMMVITCEICNARETEPGKGCGEGWGVWLDSGNITFNCYIMEPKFPERTLQSLRVKVCDLTHAGSDSNTLRLQICNEGAQHTWNEINQKGHADRLSGVAGCCTTNLFGKNFVRNEWSQIFDGDTANDDGGEVLGQCESFPINGTALNLRWINEYHGAVCVKQYEFFGGSKAGMTSVRPIPFISCTGMQTPEASTPEATTPEAVTDNVCQHWSDNNLFWGDSKQGYCEGWSNWYDWTRVNSYCTYVNQINTLKKIAIRVCDETNAGSSANIKAVIQNLDGERCTTDVFQTGGLKPGQYIEVDNIGKECRNLEIKEGIAEAWIVNADQKDNLCLTDVYFDISSSDGSTGMLKCRLNDKDPKNFKINVIDNEEEAVFAIPMSCR